jgi:hypothetical protein
MSFWGNVFLLTCHREGITVLQTDILSCENRMFMTQPAIPPYRGGRERWLSAV